MGLHRIIASGNALIPAAALDRETVEAVHGPERGGEVSARRIPEHGDPVRIDAPLRGVRAHVTQSGLAVFQTIGQARSHRRRRVGS